MDVLHGNANQNDNLQYSNSFYYWLGFLSQLPFQQGGEAILLELFDLCQNDTSPRGSKFYNYYLEHGIIEQFAMFPVLNKEFQECFLTLVSFENGCARVRIPETI